MGSIVVILQLAGLVIPMIVPTVEAAFKIKSLFELDPDAKVNIITLTGEAIRADDATIAAVNVWRAKNGLPPYVPSPLPEPPAS